MPFDKIPLTPHLGTIKLFQLTKDCSEEDRRQLIEYIGKLETSEIALREAIDHFVGHFGLSISTDPYENFQSLRRKQ